MPKTWCNLEDRDQARAVHCNKSDSCETTLPGGTTPATPCALTASS